MPRHLMIQMKVSEDEKTRIKERAEEQRMAPSAFARYLALFGELPSFFPKAPIPHEPPHEKALKAKVRQAVENDDPSRDPSRLVGSRHAKKRSH